MAGKPQIEEVEASPDAHHVIGKSQNYPVNIPLFLRESPGDPAVKVKTSNALCKL